jgi:RHS repeat-associated protein
MVYNNGAQIREYSFVKNLRGDVIGIYDSDGNVAAKYAYDAWGNHKIIDATNAEIASTNRILYRSYYYDHETKLYHLNARYYSPEWRRFISPSTSSINPQRVNGLNLYSYASNEPVNIQYNTATLNEVDFGREAVNHQPSVIPIGTASLDFSRFAFPTLSFNSLLKNSLLSLSEVSGTLSFSLTNHGLAMIDYHRIFDGIDGFTTLDNLPHPVNKLFKYVGVGLMAIDTIGAGIESYYSGHSFGQGTLNVILTGVKNYAVYQVGSYVTTAVGTWAGAKLGASIGSLAGPVGLAVGVVSGAFIGYVIDEFGDAVIELIVGWFD